MFELAFYVKKKKKKEKIPLELVFFFWKKECIYSKREQRDPVWI